MTFYVTICPVSISDLSGIVQMANETLVRVGGRMKAIRTSKGITQAQLAESTGYEPLTISRFERGAYGPSIEALERISQALNVDLVEFFGTGDTEDFHVASLRHQIVDTAYKCSDRATLLKVLRLLLPAP